MDQPESLQGGENIFQGGNCLKIDRPNLKTE